MRLADLRENHIRDTHAAMRKITTPAEEDDHSELLRRLAAARATVKHLPGKRVRRASLSETRIRRVTAPLITALNQCTALPVNPAKGTGGKIRKNRPLLWTEPRVERWRKTGKRPAPVMVWTAAQCGVFLDAIGDDRLYPLYHLAAYWGLRRSELAGLEWSDLDLKKRRLHVRQAEADDELDSTKSEDSDRIITIDQDTAAVLEAWRERQLFERLEWGDAWQDSGRVFTREDGQPLRPGHVSEHFAVLVRQAELPPVRFHDLRHGAAAMLKMSRWPAHQSRLRDPRPLNVGLHDGRLSRGGRGVGGGRRGGHRRVRAPSCQQCASPTGRIMKMASGTDAPPRSGTAFVQVAEADGDRTRRRRGAPSTGFEDRGGHQAPRRLRG